MVEYCFGEGREGRKDGWIEERRWRLWDWGISKVCLRFFFFINQRANLT